MSPEKSKEGAPKAEIVGWGLVCSAGSNAAEAAEALLSERPLPPRPSRSTLALGSEAPCFETHIDLPPTRRTQELLQLAFDEATAHAGLARSDLAGAFVLGGTTGGIVSEEHLANCTRLHESGVAVPFEGKERGPGAILATFCKENGLASGGVTLTTACTSSAMALVFGARLIESGAQEFVVVAGVEPLLGITLSGFRNLLLYDRTLCRPFSADRSGMQIGEGAAVLLLRRAGWKGTPATRARRYFFEGGALLGRNTHLTSADTSGESAAEVMRAALADAELEPADVRAVKAHGTGTADNDLAEGRGVARVFPAIVQASAPGVLAQSPAPDVFGLKSAVGHTLGAAGALETALLCACLEQGGLPATRNFTHVDPEIAFAPTRSRIPAGEGCYLLNFLGFGGSYCSYVIRAVSVESGPSFFRRPLWHRASARQILIGPYASSFLLATGGTSTAHRVPVDANAALPGYSHGPGLDASLATDPDTPAVDALLSKEQRLALRRNGRYIKLCIAGAANLLARLPRSELSRARTGLFLGSGLANQDELRLAANQVMATRGDTVSPLRFSNSVPNVALFCVAQTLGLQGPQISVSQEGESFEECLRLAHLLLARGEIDVAFVGACDILMRPYAHVPTRLGLSDDRVRAFASQNRFYGEGSFWAALGTQEIATRFALPQTRPFTRELLMRAQERTEDPALPVHSSVLAAALHAVCTQEIKERF